jgi:hypothetical protein
MMGFFSDRDFLAKEAIRQITEHVKECKENNTRLYARMDETYSALQARFDAAHGSNRKRLDAIVWSCLIGAFSAVLFLLDKIAVQKGIW